MRVIFRKRPRLRPLSERECYLRLHGARLSDIQILPPEPAAAPPPAPGPTEHSPALHLLFRYPRDGGTLTGEQLRLELLRRMEARASEAA